MIEKPFFFPNKNYHLFGILHEPLAESNGMAFVFCHPFAEEKLWAHRVMVNYARQMAAYGYTVLRFDFMGHGDSEGNFSDSTVATRLADIAAALDWLRHNITPCRELGLLGLRFGATLASIASEHQSGISRLILWEPVLNGQKYMKELLRINMSTQTAVYKEVRYNSEALIAQMQNGNCVNVDGYELSWPLYAEMIKIDLLVSPKKFDGDTLVVQINRREGAGTKRMQAFSGLYPNGTVAEAVEDLFWKEIRHYYAKADNLVTLTGKWLKENESR